MRQARWVGAILIAAVLAAAVGPALAKGETNHVTIDGPGFDQPLVVRDPQFTDDLGMAALEAVDAVAFPPAWIEEAYLVTRGYEEGERVHPFDQVLYVPDPQGGKAFVYYIGIYNGEGPYDRRWFHATRSGQETMEAILRQADGGTSAARLAGAAPAKKEAASAEATTVPSAAPRTTVTDVSSRTTPHLALTAFVVAVAGFGAGWVLRPRRASGQP
jgi:hypothetical protein